MVFFRLQNIHIIKFIHKTILPDYPMRCDSLPRGMPVAASLEYFYYPIGASRRSHCEAASAAAIFFSNLSYLLEHSVNPDLSAIPFGINTY
jgi:hypothetical protein